LKLLRGSVRTAAQKLFVARNHLGDILYTVFDRSRTVRSTSDKHNTYDLCRALLSTEDTVSGQSLAATVLSRYRSSSDVEKLAFFIFLNDGLDFDAPVKPNLGRDR
jgi:malonyl-CoA decarboxylase